MLRQAFLQSFVALLFLQGAAPANHQGSPSQYGSACPSAAEGAGDLLLAAQALRDASKSEPALHCFARAAARAAAAGEARLEAQARYEFAAIAYDQGRYQIAEPDAARALALSAGQDRALSARATRLLGMVALMRGDHAAARRQLDAALAEFAALGLDRDRAIALINLGHMDLPDEEDDALNEEALALARRIHAPDLEALALHTRSDKHFAAGRFDAAIADLTAAIALFQQTNSRGSLADSYVSLGRILRAHGRAAEALQYYDRAAVIQESLGDLTGLVQSVNSKAIALDNLGRKAESRAEYERALALAMRTGSPRVVNFAKGNLAAAYNASRDYRGAIRLLEEVIPLETEPYILAYRHSGLADNFAALHQYDRAVVHIDKAIELARATGNRELLPMLLYRGATINRALGRSDAALAAAAEAIDAVEQTRARLVPLDFMKRGFAETHQSIFGVMIALLEGRGERDRALVVSEQARARAFLDLLASRDMVAPSAASLGPLAGDAGGHAPLQSYAAASPAGASDIAATADRLRSTIVSYWVSDDELFIWVAAPGAPVRSTRVAIGRAALDKIVAASIPSRAAGGTAAFSRLYRLLIQPIRARLPPAGASLTIVPHGPLFRLSFAALRDERGAYLVERYALTYAPSVSALLQTAKRLPSSPAAGAGYLIVADPRPMPGSPRPLAPLPASRREASSIVRALGSRGTVLSGAAARESEIRRRAPEARLLHFATHGVIRDDEPFDSYLAVGVEGSAGAGDGRLTVRELYDLPLSAEIVVLSACRTATGGTSGEGIAGLSRALFYAGAPTVVATLWDVADEPSARLMGDFYRHWRSGVNKAAALRRAQLDLLRDLRAGSMRVTTRAGVIPLQEQPFYWAGYVVIGEP